MSDFLVDLGENPAARKAIKAVGLPIPLPKKLARSNEPWEDRPLEGTLALASHEGGVEFAELLAQTLTGAGAECRIVGKPEAFANYEEHGRVWARSIETLAADEVPEDLRPACLLFDASGIVQAEQLKKMYSFFHLWIRKLAPCGRALILCRPPSDSKDPIAAACSQAVDGFVRSMARELGNKGATAQSVYINKGAEKGAEPLLRFLLSRRSAYISAQPFHVTKKQKADTTFPSRRPLDGKLALVTGAARGIGAATARALAREGAHVLGMDRPSEDAALSSLMDELGGTMLLCDITGEEAPKIVSEAIKNNWDGLDIVVHNAGVTRDKTLARMDEERWDMTLGVNLVSLIALNEELKKLLNKNGRIICMSSIGGIAGNLGQCNYAASKAGVIGYVRSLAGTLGKKGITVNAVAPGFIETRMTAAVPFATREVARRLCNLGQGGQPEDIGELVCFLASPGSAGLNGEVIRICGGNYIGA